MNAGAQATEGDVLLFLHADTVLPDDALAAVGKAIAVGADWGRFDVRIVGSARMLRVVAALMNLRSRLSGIATGDQAIFVRRDVFLAVGGFPDQPLMEDIEISKRLLRRSRPACLRSRVQTSGRRWESRGVWRTIFLMWRLRFAYWRGTPAEVLARAYR
jgi:rSAM/selenodomain-associated transferase 2